MAHLRPEQKEVLARCLDRGLSSYCLGLEMGSGKTHIILAIVQSHPGKSLIVVSKTLMNHWREILDNYFPSITYEILHTEHMSKSDFENWTPDPDIKIILTTPEVLQGVYKKNNLERFVVREMRAEGRGGKVWYYTWQLEGPLFRPESIVGPLSLYTLKFRHLILDEVQTMTSIKTGKARALLGLYVEQIISMSGTPFPQPSDEHYFAFYLIHRLPSIAHYPHTFPDGKKLLEDDANGGTGQYIILGPPPKIDATITNIIVGHDLYAEEQKIYNSLRDIFMDICSEAERFKDENMERYKFYYSLKLVIIMLIRQGLVSSILPVTNAYIKFSDCNKRDELSITLLRNINNLGPDVNDFVSDEDALYSSRIKCAGQICNAHYKTSKIVIFSDLMMTLLILKSYLQERYGMIVYVMDGSTSLQKRQEIEMTFREVNNGILLMTYKLGSMGLNLQHANILIDLDLAWSYDVMQQAHARVFRIGQERNVICYTLVSNTALEKNMFEKMKTKLTIQKECNDGPRKTKMNSISIEEMCQLIESAESIDAANMLYQFKKAKSQTIDLGFNLDAHVALCAPKQLSRAMALRRQVEQIHTQRISMSDKEKEELDKLFI